MPWPFPYSPETPTNYVFTNDSAHMVTDGRYIYVGTSYGSIVKVDPLAGKVVRSAELFNYSCVFSMTFYEGSLYVGTSEVYPFPYSYGVFRVDPESLAILSNYTTGANGVADVLGAGGYIYIGSGGGWGDQLSLNLTLVNETYFPVGEPYTSMGDMAFDGASIFWQNYAQVFATDLQMGILASGTSPGGSEISCLSSIDGSTYAADQLGHVYRLSLTNGTVAFTEVITLPVSSQVVSDMLVTDGLLLVAPSGIRTSPETGAGPSPLPGSVLVYSWPGLAFVSTYDLPDNLSILGGESGLVSVDGVPYVHALNELYQVPLPGRPGAPGISIASDLAITLSSPFQDGNVTTLSVTLKDGLGNPIAGGEVEFYLAGRYVGAVTLDEMGSGAMDLATPIANGTLVQATFWGEGNDPPAVSPVLVSGSAAPTATQELPGSNAASSDPLPTDLILPLGIAAVAVLAAIAYVVRTSGGRPLDNAAP